MRCVKGAIYLICLVINVINKKLFDLKLKKKNWASPLNILINLIVHVFFFFFKTSMYYTLFCVKDH